MNIIPSSSLRYGRTYSHGGKNGLSGSAFLYYRQGRAAQAENAEALRRWALTDEERNIRINYIKPFMLPQNGQDILELNLDYVKSIAADVQSRGFKLGTSGVFNADANGYQAYFPDKMLLVLPVLAVVAAGVMYLALLLGLSSKLQYILFAVLVPQPLHWL